MKTSRTSTRTTAAFRTPRLDPARQIRLSLALITLMGLATASVMATTQALSAKTQGSIQLHMVR